MNGNIAGFDKVNIPHYILHLLQEDGSVKSVHVQSDKIYLVDYLWDGVRIQRPARIQKVRSIKKDTIQVTLDRSTRYNQRVDYASVIYDISEYVAP